NYYYLNYKKEQLLFTKEINQVIMAYIVKGVLKNILEDRGMYCKSKSLVLILLFILSTILVGCGGSAQNNGLNEEQNKESSSKENVESEDKLVIYTSIYPLYDFTKKIAGEKAEVVNLIPAGAE